MARRRPPWFYRRKRKPKQPAIDPTLPFFEQIKILQQQIDQRREAEQAKRRKECQAESKPKPRGQKPKPVPSLHLGKIVFSEEESRKVQVAWLYADPKVQPKWYMLILLSLGRTVQEVVDVLEVPVTEVLDALKLFQTLK